ncbi:MAG: thiamine-phosphate kinase [Verrucomicrobiota bacterium]
MNPFTENESESIASLGESKLISLLASDLADATPPAPHGIGDDCAVISPPSSEFQQIVTTDPVTYGQHFDDSLSPEQTAGKLLKRNLSDIAAMGGLPDSAVIALTLPKRTSIDWIRRFYKEIGKLSQRYKMQIVGGDLSTTSTDLSAHLTLIGIVSKNRILLRNWVTPNCTLYVTGTLGGSILQKHYAFEPRLAEGQWLARQSEVVSCMDLSDGLGKDLPSILSSDASVTINTQALPISTDAEAIAKRSNRSTLHHAINDGEDFELLFALSPTANLESFEKRWKAQFETPIARIGRTFELTEDSPIRIALVNTDEKVEIRGYEHLR